MCIYKSVGAKPPCALVFFDRENPVMWRTTCLDVEIVKSSGAKWAYTFPILCGVTHTFSSCPRCDPANCERKRARMRWDRKVTFNQQRAIQRFTCSVFLNYHPHHNLSCHALQFTIDVGTKPSWECQVPRIKQDAWHGSMAREQLGSTNVCRHGRWPKLFLFQPMHACMEIDVQNTWSIKIMADPCMLVSYWNAWCKKTTLEHVWRPSNRKMKSVPSVRLYVIPYVIYRECVPMKDLYMFKSHPSPGRLSRHHRFCSCWQEGCARARHAPGLPDSKCPGHNQPKEVRPWDYIRLLSL